MRFCFPWLLLLLPIFAGIAITAFYLLRKGNSRLVLFATPAILKRAGLVSKTDGSHGPRFSVLPFVQLSLLTAGLMLLVIAAARPQWGKAEMLESSRGRSLLIALDVSRSMLVSDVHPNRLERAKVDILDLIADLRGDRAGILVFRGKGLMLCPLTTDYAFLRQAVDGISVDSAPRGETDIADAISKCLVGLEGASGDNCAILLISDGEDLAGRAQRLAKSAGERGIPIFTVGIGDTSGASVPSPDGKGTMKFGGKDVKSRLTESTLKEIAAASGGVYIPLATSGTASTTLGAIYRQHLTRIAAEEFEEMLANRFVERYQLFLIPALVFLLVAAMLSKGRPSSPKRRVGVTLLLAFLMPLILKANEVPSSPQATSTRDLRTAYNQAVDAYAGGDTTNAAAILLPISNRRDFPEAAELYGAAEFAKAFDPALATNAAGRVEHLSKAALAFQTSMADSTQDERKLRNLNRAIIALPALREEARIAAVMAKEEKTPPPQLISRMLNTQREIYQRQEMLETNSNAAIRIDGYEELAKKQQSNIDLWIPLTPALTDPSVLTNEAHRAEMQKALDNMQSRMVSLKDALCNLDKTTSEISALSENDIFNLWTMVAEPPALIDEDILCETNVVESPLKPKWRTRDSGQTALALTTLFAERFPKWAENYIQQDAQRRQQEGSTNVPTFTEENVAKINELLEPLHWIQQDTCKQTNITEKVLGASEALDILYKIRDLLPKDGNGGGSSQNQAQPEQNQEQKQEQEQNQEQNQPQDQNEEQQEKAAEEEKKEDTPQDVEEDLRRALQREREHEAEKQRQRREFPMSPNVRDW